MSENDDILKILRDSESGPELHRAADEIEDLRLKLAGCHKALHQAWDSNRDRQVLINSLEKRLAEMLFERTVVHHESRSNLTLCVDKDGVMEMVRRECAQAIAVFLMQKGFIEYAESMEGEITLVRCKLTVVKNDDPTLKGSPS